MSIFRVTKEKAIAARKHIEESLVEKEKAKFKIPDNEDSVIAPRLLDVGDVVTVERSVEDPGSGKTVTIVDVGTVSALNTDDSTVSIIKSADDKEITADTESSQFYWLFSDANWSK